jgi:hypothetical protein
VVIFEAFYRFFFCGGFHFWPMIVVKTYLCLFSLDLGGLGIQWVVKKEVVVLMTFSTMKGDVLIFYCLVPVFILIFQSY